jgi:hypothetical protein
MALALVSKLRGNKFLETNNRTYLGGHCFVNCLGMISALNTMWPLLLLDAAVIYKNEQLDATAAATCDMDPIAFACSPAYVPVPQKRQLSRRCTHTNGRSSCLAPSLMHTCSTAQHKSAFTSPSTQQRLASR